MNIKKLLSISVLLIVFFNTISGNIKSQENSKQGASVSGKKPWYENFSPHISVLSYFSGIDYIAKNISQYGGDDTSRQFNPALNFDGEGSVKKNITIGYQIQASSGKDDLGIKEDAKLVVTDVYIDFRNLFGTGIGFLTGSFDTPFGDQTEVVSNNADTFRNPFLMNSLFFSVWGGALGTLNTLGAKLYYENNWLDIAFSIANGTDEEVLNSDSNLEFVANLGLDFGKYFRLAGSFIRSDDIKEVIQPGTTKDDIVGTGLNADLTAGIVDIKINLPFSKKEQSYIKGYYGYADWGDKVDDTVDQLIFWMVEAKYHFYKNFYLALRLSSWEPKDHNGDGSGISLSLPSPGIAASKAELDGFPILTDQKIKRIQSAFGFSEKEDLNIKLIFFLDKYKFVSSGVYSDTMGFILAINARF